MGELAESARPRPGGEDPSGRRRHTAPVGKVVTVGGASDTFGPQTLPGVGIDPGRPNMARVYDRWLGGKDNYAADRLVADRVAQVQPLVVAGVRANRAFLRRAVAYLARRGVRQFLDLGSGLPTGLNVHQVAGRVAPDARTVYTDIDPMVLVHARALLVDSPRTIVVEGDLREPKALLADPDVRAHLDFTQPVAVVACAVLHFVRDEEDPDRIVRAFADAMAPGSALVISHVIDDSTHDEDDADRASGGDNGDGGGSGEASGAATRRGAAIYSQTTAPFTLRTREQVRSWFHGFTLVPPGLVTAGAWRRPGNATAATSAPIVAGVGIRDRNPHDA